MSKIVIIGPAFPLRGGLASFDERLARQFTKDGHETLIYTFSLQYPNFLFPGTTQYSDSEPPKDINIKVCINSINPLNWLKVGFQLEKENADIIIVRYWLPFMAPCLGTVCRIAGRNKKTAIVALIDNILPHEKRFGDRFLSKYFTDSVDKFITMSQHVKNDLSSFTNKPTMLVNHPLIDNFGTKIDKNEARTLLNLPSDRFIFLFFGFIRKYKGLDLLIDALDFIPKDKNITLVIAGEFYAHESEIINQIASSTSKDFIISRTHYISDDEVAHYFSASDCVIQPYRSATQSGVTPLAYHFEVPMIVTNVGALPDLVPDPLGIVCEPEPKSIAAAMAGIMDLDMCKFDQEIKIEKKKLSWQQFTEAFITI